MGIQLYRLALEREIALFLIVLIEFTSVLRFGFTADLDFVTDLVLLLAAGLRTRRLIHDESQLLVVKTVHLSSIQECAPGIARLVGPP